MVKANSGQFPGYDQWGPLHLQGSCPHTQVVVTVTAAVLPEEAVGDAPVRDAGAQGFPFSSEEVSAGPVSFTGNPEFQRREQW